MASGAERIPHSSHPIAYRTLRFIISVLMRIVYRYRVTGLENVPAEGATIFAMNHLHLFDPGAAGAAIPRQVVVMAADKWADHWFVRLFLKAAGTIYVRRGEVDRVALKACLEVLNAGGRSLSRQRAPVAEPGHCSAPSLESLTWRLGLMQ